MVVIPHLEVQAMERFRMIFRYCSFREERSGLHYPFRWRAPLLRYSRFGSARPYKTFNAENYPHFRYSNNRTITMTMEQRLKAPSLRAHVQSTLADPQVQPTC